ncbi:MAG: diadenylate cyclase [Bacilli bacterium]
MTFAWESNDLVTFILTLSLIVILFVLLLLIFVFVVKRNSGYIILGVSFVFIIFSYLCNLKEVFVLTSVLLSVALFICLFANLGDLRAFIANPFKRVVPKNSKMGVERIFDRQELYKEIEATVKSLSQAKIGAIMTFEKNVSLKDIMKNGVKINAPVSQELLMTIFYPGTRLHDGAVIIHGNTIVSASVFFTPSTKPFAGKYGSRHRAAIGISEVSDAVTVVVSEETGRVSLAVNGELEVVELNSFIRVFENYMSDNMEE